MATVTGQATDAQSPGVLGQPMNVPIPDSFAIGVKGDGGSGLAFNGFIPGRQAIGVLGTCSNPNGSQAPLTLTSGNIGVLGTCSDPNGAGIRGENTAGGNAGIFTGNVAVSGNITATGNVSATKDMSVTGNMSVKGDASVTGTLNVVADIVLAGAANDCAEEFDVASSQAVEPGTVMVLDDSGSLRPSAQGYDKKVAGVISGAGEYRPGMILGRCESSQKRVPIALIGRVYCKADAQYGAIQVGDLLTTSPTSGHAMKASDPSRAFGAVIGKALRRLSEGSGLLPIIVALQ